MLDGFWRTLSEIARELGYPEASVSAQLRHLRKPEFGSYLVDKRRRKAQSSVWEYRVRRIVRGQMEMWAEQPAPAMKGH